MKVYKFEIAGDSNDAFYPVNITGTTSENTFLYVEYFYLETQGLATPLISLESSNCVFPENTSIKGLDTYATGNISTFLETQTSGNNNTKITFANNYAELKSIVGVRARNILEQRQIHLRLVDVLGAPHENALEFKIRFVLIDFSA